MSAALKPVPAAGLSFSMDRAPLLAALKSLVGVVERRSTIPILANALIVAAEDSISLTVTDMDIEVRAEVSAAVDALGVTTVPISILERLMRRLSADVTIAIGHACVGAPLVLEAAAIRAELTTIDADQFPSVPRWDVLHRFEVPAAVLRGLIDRSRFAISTEEVRYYLNGLYFHTVDGATGPLLRVAATDGHRLARVETELPGGAAGMPGVIVPRKAIAVLRRLINTADGPISVELGDPRIRFGVGSVVMTCKPIDGTFPDYERVIPRDTDKVLRVSNGLLAGAIARVATISQERSRPVKLSLERDKVTLSGFNPESGRMTEILEGGTVDYTGMPIEIAFQARYLADICKQMGNDIEFRFKDHVGPTVIRDVDSLSAIYVLMPMRV